MLWCPTDTWLTPTSIVGFTIQLGTPLDASPTKISMGTLRDTIVRIDDASRVKVKEGVQLTGRSPLATPFTGS